jgi:nitrate/nitrite transporter NarK
MAGVVTGALIDAAGWRAAFVVPGVVSALAGVALVLCCATGLIQDPKETPPPASVTAKSDSRRVFSILLVTMFLGGLIYHSTQASLPKVIELRQQGLAGEGAFGVGLLVALVYTAAGVMQILGGHLADRLPLKQVYTGAILAQVPLLLLASSSRSGAHVVDADGDGQYHGSPGGGPSSRPPHAGSHGLAFGEVRPVLRRRPARGQLASRVAARTGEFHWLFLFLGIAPQPLCWPRRSCREERLRLFAFCEY